MLLVNDWPRGSQIFFEPSPKASWRKQQVADAIDRKTIIRLKRCQSGNNVELPGAWWTPRLRRNAQAPPSLLHAEDTMPRRISAQDLIALTGTDRFPHVVDVRREAIFRQAPTRIAAAVWRDHMKTAEWSPEFRDGKQIVVYCAHGHNVSEIATAGLARAGADVAMLDGGIDAYEEAGGVLVSRAGTGVDVAAGPSVWVTRERPKIDRIACPWLIRRFIDPFAVFHFVAAEWVKDVAEEIGAIPYDIKEVHYSHRAEDCTFDTLIAEFGLSDPALLQLARIVRGADTARLDIEPQAAGLLAVSLGLSATEQDDLRQLEKGMIIYDALYGWCRHATAERHNWPVAA